jgi:hypothetical protein
MYCKSVDCLLGYFWSILQPQRWNFSGLFRICLNLGKIVHLANRDEYLKGFTYD